MLWSCHVLEKTLLFSGPPQPLAHTIALILLLSWSLSLEGGKSDVVVTFVAEHSSGVYSLHCDQL